MSSLCIMWHYICAHCDTKFIYICYNRYNPLTKCTLSFSCEYSMWQLNKGCIKCFSLIVILAHVCSTIWKGIHLKHERYHIRINRITIWCVDRCGGGKGNESCQLFCIFHNMFYLVNEYLLILVIPNVTYLNICLSGA